MKFLLFPLVMAVAAAIVSASSANEQATNRVVVGYYSPSDDLKVEDIDISKYTHINYAHGILRKDKVSQEIDIDFEPDKNDKYMRQLVELGRAANVSILMSIGGRNGPQTFSEVAANDADLEAFVEKALIFVKDMNGGGYNMTGINIDWELPGSIGSTSKCNKVSMHDIDLLFSLLKRLREQLHKEFLHNKKLLTATVHGKDFDFDSAFGFGLGLAVVENFVTTVDWVSVMTFDFMYRGVTPKYTFSDSIAYWTDAGWPANKLVAGFAFYGISMDPIATGITLEGDTRNMVNWNRYCNKNDTSKRGQLTWNEIRAQVLTSNSTTPAQGWTRHWDNDTQTPWLLHTNKTSIAYDDVESLNFKIKQVKKRDLRGVMLQEISYDNNNELTRVMNQVRLTSVAPNTTAELNTTALNSTSSNSGAATASRSTFWSYLSDFFGSGDSVSSNSTSSNSTSSNYGSGDSASTFWSWEVVKQVVDFFKSYTTTESTNTTPMLQCSKSCNSADNKAWLKICSDVLRLVKESMTFARKYALSTTESTTTEIDSSTRTSETTTIDTVPVSTEKTLTDPPCPHAFSLMTATAPPQSSSTSYSTRKGATLTGEQVNWPDYKSVTGTRELGICGPVPAWSSATTYAIPGNHVVFDGRVWYNQWYSINDTPTPGGVWKEC